jgi:hypothetical protein
MSNRPYAVPICSVQTRNHTCAAAPIAFCFLRDTGIQLRDKWIDYRVIANIEIQYSDKDHRVIWDWRAGN